MQNAATPGAGTEAPAPPPGKSGESGAPASNVIAPPKPLAPDARAIIGAENLKVYLEVDYIRFREAPAADEAKGGAAPAKAKS